MLSEEEKNEIIAEVAQYPVPANACIDALKIVQQHRGWISDESVADIARILDMSAAQVDDTATFYSRIYRKPVGRHILLICDSVTCLIMGYESIYEHVSKKLGIRFGETTSDGRYTLLPISCLGDCDHAPAVMVDDDHYVDLTPERMDEIIESYK
ncbi:MAG: NADH-quinone oxidoreductase subunit NuoE [Bacteroidales bacterium]